MVLARAWFIVCYLAVLACPSLSLAAQRQRPNIDTVVVCANGLLKAAQPWIEYRRRQGHEIALIPGGDSPEEILRAIRAIAKNTKLRYVVLIGDSPKETQQDAAVATFQVEAKVIQKWGAEPSFASDHPYGDVNEDGIPDLAVGRLCADSPSELSAIITKTLAYERAQDLGLWRRRVNLVAGVGGFGVLTDKVLETAAKRFLATGIPPEYRTSMTQASWRSSYSPDPRRFQEQTIERMNQGCLAWVYLGHGRKRALDVYRVPGGGLPILSTADTGNISVREGAPFAVFLSCYAGAFDAEPDCLAEALLATPNGPVAVIAGSSVTMPYAMTVMGNAMLHELFANQRETLGDVLLHAKQELAKKPSKEKFLNQLAALLSPDPTLLHLERQEHVRLFHLLGDPLLRIRYPEKITLKVPEYATAGTAIECAGSSTVNGPCLIELVCRRDRLRFKPPARPQFVPTDDWLTGLQETYGKANDTVWSSQKRTIVDGTFSVQLEVPPEARGPCHVRIYVQGEEEFAMGSADVYLQIAPEPETVNAETDAATDVSQ